ncbi:MAG TPA: right-handed parallel beta-helix repeat-containing protein, partial [Planctomycetota bacterium]|nr:right-handed parallel beta-helix repeat-containing protein [Planctomycetota bacterium]
GRPMWAAESPETRQLFVNGRRALRTRLPKEGTYQIDEVLDQTARAEDGARRFRYKEGDLKPWANLSDVEVVALHFWHEERLPVESLDEKERIVRFQKKSIRRLAEAIRNQPARYFVENVVEALDSPGQFYWDRREGIAYYLPRPGEEARTSEMIVPQLRHVVRFDGARHVRLRGMTVSHTEAYCPASKNKDTELSGPSQAAVTAPGAIVFENAAGCAFEDGAVEHVGSYGIEIGPGCSGIEVLHNTIRDLGAGGLKIGDWTSGANPARDAVVADNRIFEGGLLFPSACGILICHSGGNRILHNDIHDFFYTGISVGWTWGYRESAARDNRIEANHIHHLGRRVLSDMGGIYTLGPSPGTVLRRNLIHDIDAFDYGGWGIYFDEGSTGILAEENVVYNTKDGGLHQHYGKENIARNNVFAFAREAQVARSRLEKHLSFTFEQNIVLWKEGEFFHKGYSDTPGEQVAFHRNVYWQVEGKPVTFGGLTLEAWQKLGQDQDSIVADPLFVAPEKGDFTLRPDSPALKLGFRPIDLSGVGPRR